METNNTALQALQEGANNIGLTIYEYALNDKRKTIKHYFAQQGQYTVSTKLNYTQMNHFLLGWIKADKYKSKAEKAAPYLLESLQQLVEKCLRTADTSLMHQELYNAQQSINKATN